MLAESLRKRVEEMSKSNKNCEDKMDFNIKDSLIMKVIKKDKGNKNER